MKIKSKVHKKNLPWVPYSESITLQSNGVEVVSSIRKPKLQWGVYGGTTKSSFKCNHVLQVRSLAVQITAVYTEWKHSYSQEKEINLITR